MSVEDVKKVMISNALKHYRNLEELNTIDHYLYIAKALRKRAEAFYKMGRFIEFKHYKKLEKEYLAKHRQKETPTAVTVSVS